MAKVSQTDLCEMGQHTWIENVIGEGYGCSNCDTQFDEYVDAGHVCPLCGSGDLGRADALMARFDAVRVAKRDDYCGECGRAGTGDALGCTAECVQVTT